MRASWRGGSVGITAWRCICFIFPQTVYPATHLFGEKLREGLGTGEMCRQFQRLQAALAHE